jgi:hypothetical protein
MRFDPSIRAGSEGSTRVLGPGQNVGMKTRPGGQSTSRLVDQGQRPGSGDDGRAEGDLDYI